MTTTVDRPNPSQVKVICLGLGRTGTSSLRDALDMLGFGPSYHMSAIIQGGGKDYATWCKIGDGNGEHQDFDSLFHGYGSVTDYPAAMYPAELYAAYPNAKFILTTRDPIKWEKSMKETILPAYAGLRNLPEKNEIQEAAAKWSENYCEGKYHRNRLRTDTQQELLDHNERVKQTIPPEKLLIYQVGEGWDPLVQFLDVAKPLAPFPHVNDTAEFQRVAFPIAGLATTEGSK